MISSADKSKILVAYFSCTGNTRAVAMHITDALNTHSDIANLHEIKPVVPYTPEDLNWRDNKSRSSLENADLSSRPAILGNILNIENYDIIFLGYPSWWGQAPKIIYTFIESYDFSGKTIIPFCTSGSSPIGSSATNLQRHSSTNTTWLSGIRFSANTSRSSIVTWLNRLDLDFNAN
jgi:flavodoxin